MCWNRKTVFSSPLHSWSRGWGFCIPKREKEPLSVVWTQQPLSTSLGSPSYQSAGKERLLMPTACGSDSVRLPSNYHFSSSALYWPLERHGRIQEGVQQSLLLPHQRTLARVPRQAKTWQNVVVALECHPPGWVSRYCLQNKSCRNGLHLKYPLNCILMGNQNRVVRKANSMFQQHSFAIKNIYFILLEQK